MTKIWLFNRTLDLGILALPVWISWLVCFLLPASFLHQEVSLVFWVIIVLGIDVSHVWSTLFRTYLDPEEYGLHRKLLIAAPLISLTVFFVLAFLSFTLFWTVLAYLALYHFIKQQYGFMQLYKARYGFSKQKQFISDKTALYLGMLYPVLYWHINSDRNFSWFVPGDFINVKTILTHLSLWDNSLLTLINQAGSLLYFALLGAWLFQEIYMARKTIRMFPWGKVLWVLTTAGNWYLGIVFFNSDFAFSLTNIVAHGVPYMALIFMYVLGKKQLKNPISKTSMALQLTVILLAVFLLAFGEEYLWDMFMYRDNARFFEAVIEYPFEALSHPVWQAVALAALSLPQVTHYILDGFIWKARHNPYVKKVLLE